jgi:integrase
VADKLTDLLKARKDGNPIVADSKTVETFLEEWLKATKHNVRPRTWQRYEEYVRLHVTPHIGKVKLSKLCPQHLQRLYSDRIEEGLSAQSVVHLHRMLHKALSQGLRWGQVARNVTQLVDPPRVPRRTMQALSPQQAAKLVKTAAGDPLEALYVLAVTAGLREGELLALRWRDVDIDGRTLRVMGSLQNLPGEGLTIVEPKTAHSRRRLAIGALAADALRRHRTRQKQERLRKGGRVSDDDLVFANGQGRPINPSNLLSRSYRPLLTKAGLPTVRFHDLRHTAATLLLGEGVHPKIVSEMLGHSTVGITLDLYSHVTPTMQQEAADTLDSLIGRQFGRQTGSE